MFIFSFTPSKEQHRQFFIDHYDEIQEDFDQFVSLEKYDNEFSKLLLTTNKSDNNDNSNDDTVITPNNNHTNPNVDNNNESNTNTNNNKVTSPNTNNSNGSNTNTNNNNNSNTSSANSSNTNNSDLSANSNARMQYNPFRFRHFHRFDQVNKPLKENRSDFKIYELEKIPKEISSQLPQLTSFLHSYTIQHPL